jgi:hypothetical protein
MTDLMVDTETTGLYSPDSNGILQLAAIKFNFETGEIGPFFDRCPALLPNRYWEEGTRRFWQVENAQLYHSFVMRAEDPAIVFSDFTAFVCGSPPLRFWAKPTRFDWPIVESHYTQLGLPMPFQHWNTRDLNTYIAARCGGVEHVDMSHIEMEGTAHNALADSVHQLKMLFAAKAGDFGRVAEDGLEYAEFTEVAA